MATVATARLEARVSQEEKDFLEEAAARRGISLTELVTSSAHKAAVEIVKEHSLIELSQRDQERFVNALFEPERAGDRLRALAGRPAFKKRR